MTGAEASLYRGIAARLKYLAQDRTDIQYACKEASRRMARPRLCDWPAFKRIGRYLKGAPRYVQMFAWQAARGRRHLHGLRLGRVQEHLPQYKRRSHDVGSSLLEELGQHASDGGIIKC